MTALAGRPSSLAGLIVLVLSALVSPPPRVGADELEPGATWSELTGAGRGVVFGRILGRFDGTEYRGRKLLVRNKQTGKEYDVGVEPGLGDFAAVLPVGSYALVAIEAVYFPRIRPAQPGRYPPVPQRYELKPLPESGLPTFPVVSEHPLYLGTIRSGVGGEGLVYDGHAIEIVDEFADAVGRLQGRYPELFQSLTASGVEPTRFFFLKPAEEPDPLELATIDDPLKAARDYLEDGKFRQALSWLSTFMPMNDEERVAVRLLVGEIHLADKRYDEAIEELGEVLFEEPENVRALRLLARAHAFAGHREDALGLYRGLAESVPEDAEAFLHLGYEHALSSAEKEAERAFDAAFASNFDYLLHDLSPYALALGAKGAEYAPPEVEDGVARLPSTLRSRRSEGAFALLVDHRGKVVAAHLTPSAEDWAPATMMAFIRARFRPAKLNGVPIPCLIIVGADNLIRQAN